MRAGSRLLYRTDTSLDSPLNNLPEGYVCVLWTLYSTTLFNLWFRVHLQFTSWCLINICYSTLKLNRLQVPLLFCCNLHKLFLFLKILFTVGRDVLTRKMTFYSHFLPCLSVWVLISALTIWSPRWINEICKWALCKWDKWVFQAEEETEVRVGRFFLGSQWCDHNARLINLRRFRGAAWHLIFTLPAVSSALLWNYSQ